MLLTNALNLKIPVIDFSNQATFAFFDDVLWTRYPAPVLVALKHLRTMFATLQLQPSLRVNYEVDNTKSGWVNFGPLEPTDIVNESLTLGLKGNVNDLLTLRVVSRPGNTFDKPDTEVYSLVEFVPLIEKFHDHHAGRFYDEAKTVRFESLVDELLHTLRDIQDHIKVRVILPKEGFGRMDVLVAFRNNPSETLVGISLVAPLIESTPE